MDRLGIGLVHDDMDNGFGREIDQILPNRPWIVAQFSGAAAPFYLGHGHAGEFRQLPQRHAQHFKTAGPNNGADFNHGHDRGQHHQRQHGGGDQSPDHHDGQRLLHLRPRPGGEEERDEAQQSHGRRHHHRAETQGCPLNHRLANRFALVTQVADIGDQHHAIEHRNAPERDKAHRGRHREIFPRHRQPHDPADRGERQHQNDQRGQTQRVEQDKQQEEDRRHRDRNDDHQMAQRALHILELAAPFEVIAVGQLDLGIDLLLQLGHETAKVTALDVHADDDAALAHFAADLGRAVRYPHLGNVGQTRLRAAG
ncbi:hypothetical protein E4T56_gene15007, partial [Termitomyces sp. T112]